MNVLTRRKAVLVVFLLAVGGMTGYFAVDRFAQYRGDAFIVGRWKAGEEPDSTEVIWFKADHTLVSGRMLPLGDVKWTKRRASWKRMGDRLIITVRNAVPSDSPDLPQYLPGTVATMLVEFKGPNQMVLTGERGRRFEAYRLP